MRFGRKGRKAREFFNKQVLPIISELLNDLTDDEAFNLFSLFTSMDKDKDGTISCDEFHKLVGIKDSLIIERLWLVLTTDCENSASISFHDFFRVVSRLKDFEVKDFASFTFNIFDINGRGTLSIYEIDAMIRMITSREEADQTFMKHIRLYSSSDEITLAQFTDAVQSKQEIMNPLLHVQGKLQNCTWSNKSKLRKRLALDLESSH